MPETPRRSARSLFRRLAHEASSSSLLLDPRRRRHLAILAVALVVTVFAYGALQPRKVRVQADGHETIVTTRMAKDSAVLRGAGVDLHAGDRVTVLHSPGADVLRVERAHLVILHADGTVYQLQTHALTIDQLLAEAGVAIGDRDSVVQDGELVSVNSPVEPPRLFANHAGLGSDPGDTAGAITIDVRRAMAFAISEGGRVTTTSSSQQTVAEALREAGVIVGPGDAVIPPEQAPLEPDAQVVVRHAKPVTVTLPDDHRVLYTLADTVGEALTAAGVVVPDGAFTEPSLSTPITPGMAVRVVQLSASSDLEREYIASSTVYKADPSLPPGETRIVAGHDGARVRQYAVNYVDGQEQSRTLVDEYFDPEPVDTVIYYPTQTRAVQAAPPASSDGKTLHVYATWYSAASSGRAPSDPAYGHTATGVTVTYGIVAVDPDVIPLGTKMFIPGYGYAVAADTGGAVKGYVIDLGYPDGVQVDWKSHWVDITILS